MRFLWIKLHLFNDASTFDEVSLTWRLRYPVDCYHLVFLFIIRTDCNEIVSFCFLEFEISYITLELHAHSESLSVFFSIFFIPVPGFVTFRRKTRLKENIAFFSDSFLEFPKQEFHLLTMRKSKDVTNWPVNRINRLFILFGEELSATEYVPHNDEAAGVTCSKILSWSWYSHC